MLEVKVAPRLINLLASKRGGQAVVINNQPGASSDDFGTADRFIFF